ncbi:Protein kinase domain [Dillenia turbinata]|uniref:Protein kinase domain n=1 Tax=Dillenia turbinata TaxID=194707 RepID=A0AAN8V4B9_9MAGN
MVPSRFAVLVPRATRRLKWVSLVIISFNFIQLFVFNNENSLTCAFAQLTAGAAAAAAGILLTAFVFIVSCSTSRIFIRKMFLSENMPKNDQNIEEFIKNFRMLTLKRYSHYDIKKMTNSFKEKLGQGGFGDVYKGKLPDGRLVAVKVLSTLKGNGEEFINEVASIGKTSHVNIVALLGYCFKPSKRALIYEFMSNGSLDKFIYDRHLMPGATQLSWQNLYHIAIGIARGLEYLHCGCSTRILHLDIKPHNILLDEDFNPKISDFGLSRLCTRKESIVSMLEARGTIGYIAPEVVCRNFGGVSHKSDVYSYGMMILEMVGGRKNLDVRVTGTSKIYFPDWVYKHLEKDGDLGLNGIMTTDEDEKARKMVLVSLWCIQTDPSQRPSIGKVLEMLQGSISALEVPPKPFLSSPPRSSTESTTIS